MTRGVKIFIGVLLILISIWGIALYGAGSHGHFMFRPHMTEDWLIWGTVLISGTLGVILLTKQIRNKTKVK